MDTVVDALYQGDQAIVWVDDYNLQHAKQIITLSISAQNLDEDEAARKCHSLVYMSPFSTKR